MQSRTLRFVFVALFLAGLASFCLAAAAQAQEDTAHLVLRKKVTAKGSPSVYIVQKGDNLSTIIRRKLGKPASESASVSRLVRKLNPQIRDVNRIYPGQKIALPRLASEPGKTGYVVRKGDSLSAILHERLGVPAAEMARWIGLTKKLNPGLADPNRIYPGQALILPDRGQPTPAPVERAAGPAQADAPTMDARMFRPTDRDLDIIAALVRLSGGTVVRSGRFSSRSPKRSIWPSTVPTSPWWSSPTAAGSSWTSDAGFPPIRPASCGRAGRISPSSATAALTASFRRSPASSLPRGTTPSAGTKGLWISGPHRR
ncbi:MAG: LysM peptidoglycan-binding domain-containing protein [Desulfosudis oleivorans]|nr:LysM peptidoglycan-binding domain-containing protein [Desulfosudis oleivorans]